jgi:hypothetical protein
LPSPALLQADRKAAPRVAVAAAGTRNRHSHPAPARGSQHASELRGFQPLIDGRGSQPLIDLGAGHRYRQGLAPQLSGNVVPVVPVVPGGRTAGLGDAATMRRLIAVSLGVAVLLLVLVLVLAIR